MTGLYQKAGNKRRRRRHCRNMDDNISFCIPDDLLVEILVRLPLLCIIRCKSVSRAWKRLISDKFFPITRVSNPPITHLLCSRREFYKPNSKYMKVVDHYSTIGVQEIDRDDNPPSLNTPLNMSFLPWQGRQLRQFTILDSCNGLILSRIRSSTLIVINPSNQTWILLPSLPPPCLSYLNYYHMALVFDPNVSQHFKVIFPTPSIKQVKLVVLSSESGVWTASYKQVPLPISLDKKLVSTVGLISTPRLIDGALYLSALGKLIRFHVDEETSELIDLPAQSTSKDLRHLYTWKGCLQWCEFSLLHARMQVWELQDWSTSRWTLRHTLSYVFLLDELFVSFIEVYFMQACFHPNKDAIYVRIGRDNIICYEFDNERKKVINLENFYWSQRLFPLSPCLVNLFEINKTCHEEIGLEKLMGETM